ncbi:MAG TPA: hypothetical protein VLK82_19890 [Candidatus Tectomicrobia bacterium]|nr:hypothetical protein [Candidatus Tectomicrobia bacterium]
MALAVNLDTPGHVEFTFTAARPALGKEESAVFGELLHAAVQAIHHEEIIFWIEGHAGWAVEIAISQAGCPPLADPVATLSESGVGAVWVGIADIDSSKAEASVATTSTRHIPARLLVLVKSNHQAKN